MVRLLVMLSVAAAWMGCAGRHYKVDHPVVGPPPPRIGGARAVAANEALASQDARGQSEVQQASGADARSFDGPIPMTAVAARVNGQPILVGTVMTEVRGRLAAAKSQISPEQFRQLQEEFLKERLPTHIEQALMVHAVKTRLKEEQLKNVETQLDEQFNSFVAKKFQGPNGPLPLTEVEAILQAQGLTLHQMRKMFGDRAIAEQFIGMRLGELPQVNRQELLKLYQERQADYAEPEQVKWQQIRISFGDGRSRADAERLAQDASEMLRKGAPFSDVARKHSDGPDASNGGHWDWTQVDSLSNELREPLSTLPAGRPSPVIRSASSFQIVQVVERQQARVRPFEDVQSELREELIQSRHRERAEKLMDELRSSAVIETMFDEPGVSSSAGPAERGGVSHRKSAFSRGGS
ncbi:MAG: peptidylprolyl isomerase [Planctomyces sp.]|nr:peptidylprolyl isomerase [Planctomyces sp.]